MTRFSRFSIWLTLFLPLVISSPGFQYGSGQPDQVLLQPTTNGINGTAPSLGLFAPVETLSVFNEHEFTTFGHPYFPAYSVRMKKSQFCDDSVNGYTGYIDIEARHLFFYFFESRNDPATDDVIFWTNGGPGCSSAIGLFMELGPCRALDANGPTFHPESWNTNANIFFVDQPIGVGFSYADHGEYVGSTEEAAKDIASFVAIFFENFSQFKGRAFHMAGESYGGRYLPLFASAVYDQNAALIEAGMTPVNLKSAMIGNGITDSAKILLSYYDMVCTPATLAPFVSIESCVAMKATLARCEDWLTAACHDHYDAIDCGAAYSFCGTQYRTPFALTGKNPYDISRQCEGEPGDLCYPQTRHIKDFLSRSSTHQLLGVDPAARKPFSSCSSTVGEAFAQTQDVQHRTSDYVAALLERGIRVLIYVGTYDWICNHVGNERWTVDLEWSGQEEFAGQELRNWTVEGKVAGKTRSARGFTYATIDAAGHMVPYDKPKESLALVQRWLAGDEI